jgi:hypothetical protein
LFPFEEQDAMQGFAFMQGFEHGVDAKQKGAFWGSSMHGC